MCIITVNVIYDLEIVYIYALVGVFGIFCINRVDVILLSTLNFRISTNLETLKSSKIRVSDEKPPASPCPRDPAASFSSSCPWYGLVDCYAGMTVGKTRTSGFSLNAVMNSFSSGSPSTVDRLTPSDLWVRAWICRSFYSPLLRWWRNGRADNDSANFYLLFSFSFPKC